jgi:hypothetical protein
MYLKLETVISNLWSDLKCNLLKFENLVLNKENFFVLEFCSIINSFGYYSGRYFRHLQRRHSRMTTSRRWWTTDVYLFLHKMDRTAPNQASTPAACFESF